MPPGSQRVPELNTQTLKIEIYKSARNRQDKIMNRKIAGSVSISVTLLLLVTGCAPTVKVAVPEEPITINLNVKIEHEIRVKIDKDLDELISSDSGLF